MIRYFITSLFLNFFFLCNAQEKEDSLRNTANVYSISSDKALLHFYRVDGFVGAAINYNIFFDDSIICRSKNKWKASISVGVIGNHIISAKTESKTELKLSIEAGKEYYIRSSVVMGFMIGHPKLELVDIETGKDEYKTLKKMKKVKN